MQQKPIPQGFLGPRSAHSMGGKATARNMTPEELSERGRKAGIASAAVRKAARQQQQKKAA